MSRPAGVAQREPRAARPPARRAAVYILVLAATALISVMVLGGMAVQRVQRRTAEVTADAAAARELARSAVDVGLELIRSDANWRATRGEGTWLNGVRRNSGAFSLFASDPVDDDVANNPDDPLTLRGVGQQGQAEQLIEVTLSAVYTPLLSIQGALHAGGALSFAIGSSATARGTFSTNLGATATLATVTAPVEAATTVLGATFVSGARSAAGVRAMPDAGLVAEYVKLATPIAYASLPFGTLRRVLLSPGNNPFGPTNPLGVYVIDCGGADLSVQDCRIVGTLIVRNPGAGSGFTRSINAEAAMPGMPLLLVQGNLQLNTSSGALSEASILQNLNPDHTPYRGQSNATSLDSFPSQLRGLVYATGNLNIQGSVNVQGALLCAGDASIAGSITVTHDESLTSVPPAHFRTGPVMTVVPGTWKRVVN